MNQTKARDFWKTVVDNAATLCALLDTPSPGPELQDTIQRIGQLVQALREAAADIDPVLSVEVDQVPSGQKAELRIAVTCNHNPDGLEAVQALVAVAPPMPAGIRVYAFSQPIPTELLRQLSSLELPEQTVLIHQVLFTAEPSPLAPGAFDIVCFVPGLTGTEMDLDSVPGALIAHIVLSMGIGELRAMTRVSSLGIAAVEQAPSKAVPAWDLIALLDSGFAH